MSNSVETAAMTIGALVKELQAEFDNVSISKIRFLENEGLIRPNRSKGGYRKFSRDDLDRLRIILRLQNNEYLPLSVIKERLETGADTVESLPAAQRAASESGASNNGSANDGFPHEDVSGDELARLTGINNTDVTEMEKYGIIKGKKTSDGLRYGREAYQIALVSKDLGRFGLEPRHLRMFANFADREAALCQQALGPVTRRTPEALHKSQQSLKEIVGALTRFREAMLARALKENFRDLI